MSRAPLLSRQGQLWTWGAGKDGQLGLGHSITFTSIPRRVFGDLATRVFATADCGADHTAAVTLEGEVYTCGCARGGRLGLANVRDAASTKDLEVWINCFELTLVAPACVAAEGAHRPRTSREAAAVDEGAGSVDAGVDDGSVDGGDDDGGAALFAHRNAMPPRDEAARRHQHLAACIRNALAVPMRGAPATAARESEMAAHGSSAGIVRSSAVASFRATGVFARVPC